jgi:ribosome-binding factor A
MTKHYTRAPSNRQLQVARELRGAIAEYFVMGEYYHPALENVIITVSEVRISPDLKIATAFILLSEDIDRKSIIKVMKEIAPEVRRAITSKLQLRFSPEIRFVLDEAEENALKIDSIFDNLHKKRA